MCIWGQTLIMQVNVFNIFGIFGAGYLQTYVPAYVHTVRSVHTLLYDLCILYILEILYILHIPYDPYISAYVPHRTCTVLYCIWVQ